MGVGVGNVLEKSEEMAKADSRWQLSSLLDGKDDHMGGGMARSYIGIWTMVCK